MRSVVIEWLPVLGLVMSMGRFSIPTASMQPSLMIGDVIIVDRISWGMGRYSYPLQLPLEHRLPLNVPERGDVAVFMNEKTDELYVKRIIGLPGDVIQLRGGILYLNGSEIPRTGAGHRQDVDSSGNSVPADVYVETLPSGVSYQIQEILSSGPLDETPEYYVPPDSYFMLGDNRDKSMDSRVLGKVGYIPATNLIGKVLMPATKSVVQKDYVEQEPATIAK